LTVTTERTAQPALDLVVEFGVLLYAVDEDDVIRAVGVAIDADRNPVRRLADRIHIQ